MVFWKRKTINLGDQSVTELTILEWKKYFSIKLFNFHPTTGKQDRFHTHAFNAYSFRISGDYIEEVVDDFGVVRELNRSRNRLIYIPANQYHRITRSKGCRTLLITGPWGDEFRELRPATLEDGTVLNCPPTLSMWKTYVCGKHRVDIRTENNVILRGVTK